MGKIENNSVTVTSSGTAVRFTTQPTPIKSVLISANKGNSGDVYIGDSSVTTSNTPYLEPGERESFTFKSDVEETSGDLSDFWVDADNNGDGVTFIAVDLS